ncbi:ArsR/SmtB family transcription factor [Halorhodospira halophila]|uniref:Transcriptional regulator, ArsR family n=1 Tax=Halorhodospira halophila (strain DSM 244 / SL1) TaxID=349124 RepID=A1WUR7_HALHL|nr:metalloregulator ArsR/SmtB family transcription factor [Halorhodospira halophila]ABM61429.1 transcriptional regulator, ArsR family [Halorhodospira halophila SL1]MBK1728675.1 ArsR family transcriptional regulator [Halorhodospira halophila]
MAEPINQRKLLEQLAGIGKALGHAYRLELLELLAQRERNVDELTRLTGIPLASVSQHLQQLRRTGMISARKEGTRVYYTLADEQVTALLGMLREVAERNIAEVRRMTEQYSHDSEALDAIGSEELLERLRAGMVTLIDVRPPEEFAAGHLPGAINIPAEELEAHLDELPAGREIVAYCRGPYCALSIDAVRQLRTRGRQAYRLARGFPEWKAQGLPVQ